MYSEIIARIGSDIPKSTVATWCRGVKTPKGYQKRVDDYCREKLVTARKVSIELKKERREKYLSMLHSKYEYLGKFISIHLEASEIALAILYVAEGSKSSNQLMFGNSDPGIIKLFLSLFRRCFVLDESKFRCTVQCRADQNISQLEDFWSALTEIPPEQFYASRIDPRSVGKPTRKTSYKGVCRLDYLSVEMYNKISAMSSILIASA